MGLLQTRRSKRELATNETHILKNMAFETVFLKNRLTETLVCHFDTNETHHFSKSYKRGDQTPVCYKRDDPKF